MSKYIEGVVKKVDDNFTIIDTEKENFKLKNKFLKRALFNDRVLLRIKSNKAHVHKILERDKTPFHGEVIVSENTNIAFLRSYNENHRKDFHIKNGEGLNNGDVVEAILDTWEKDKKSPVVICLNVLKRNEVNENKKICKKYNLSDFSEDTVKEIEQMSIKVDINNRVNLTDIDTFSLVSKNNVYVDNAFSFETTVSGYAVAYHIPDVDYYISNNSKIIKDIRSRVCSLNTLNFNYNLLPDRLYKLLSFNENSTKYAITCMICFDKQWNVLSETFFKSVIKTDKVFDYQSFDNISDSKWFMITSIIETIGEKLSKKYFNFLNEEKIKKYWILEKDKIKIKIGSVTKAEIVLSNWKRNINHIASKYINIYECVDDYTPSRIEYLCKLFSKIENRHIDVCDFKKYIHQNYDRDIVKYILNKNTKPIYYTLKKEKNLHVDNYLSPITNVFNKYIDILNIKVLLKKIKKPSLDIFLLEDELKYISTRTTFLDKISNQLDKLNYLNFMEGVKYSFNATIVNITEKGILVYTEYNNDAVCVLGDNKTGYDKKLKMWKINDKIYSVGEVIKVEIDSISWKDLKLNVRII
jgi:exoribonuclease R